MDITIIKGQIPLLQDSCIEQINKGYSSDKKYIVHLNNNRKFLLRLFDLNEYELKLNEFSCLEKMRNFEVKCSRPIEIGKLSQVGYMLLSFIDGHDALEQFPNLSDREQFNIGYEAGKELKKIHLYIAPKHISPWHERKAKKHKKYLDEYFACGMRIKNDDYIIKFIEQNIKLIKERPNVFQHDDFHVGNIIINDSKKITDRQRRIADEWIRKNALGWGVGSSSVAEINKKGIVRATHSGFRRAIASLNRRLNSRVEYLLIDAFYIPYIRYYPMRYKKARKNQKLKDAKAKQLAIINGDEKSLSIAAASIIAKVYRDNLMIRLSKDRKYSHYHWDRNKGYGTKEHIEAIKKFGVTRLHRRKFVEKILQ